MVTTSLCGICSGTEALIIDQGHAYKSLDHESRSRLFEPNTARSLESTQKSPDACVLERLRR